MNKRLGLTFISSFLLFVICFFFLWAKEQCAAPMPVPSVYGGYYDETIYLELSAPDKGTIYYTTDGSKPTTESRIYQGKFPIENRSHEPNLYNSVQNVVLDWKTYAPSTAPVEKGTVVRAIYVNDLGFHSDILTQTYFIGLTPPSCGYTLSIVFEYDDLYGENGIYVTGKEYDNWYLSGGAAEDAPTPNYLGNNEVPAVAELLDSSGDILNQNIGLKLQGRSSRRSPVKRFSLVSRSEYSGSDFFDITLYESVSTHSVMLKSAFPDAIAADLLSDRNVALQQSIPVKVYLNGEFFYDSYMLERYDSTYFRQYYQVENYQLIKNNVSEFHGVVDPDLPDYEEYMYWVRHTDFSDPEQYEQFLQESDVQSYIDYLVANYFMCNMDFNDEFNYVLWRSASPGKGEYEDTRWRWCIYDIDALTWVENNEARGKAVAFNVFSHDFGVDMNDTTLYSSLKGNPEFCKQFVLTFMDMLNNNFAPANVKTVLEEKGISIDWVNAYFENRPKYAVDHLAQEFQLTGQLETVTIKSPNSDMGQVTVNTSVIDLSPSSWTGSYFTDYPITVTATANDGYVFLGWKGAADSTDNTLIIPVDGGIVLEPMFAKSES